MKNPFGGRPGSLPQPRAPGPFAAPGSRWRGNAVSAPAAPAKTVRLGRRGPSPGAPVGQMGRPRPAHAPGQGPKPLTFKPIDAGMACATYSFNLTAPTAECLIVATDPRPRVVPVSLRRVQEAVVEASEARTPTGRSTSASRHYVSPGQASTSDVRPPTRNLPQPQQRTARRARSGEGNAPREVPKPHGQQREDVRTPKTGRWENECQTDHGSTERALCVHGREQP